MGVVDVCCCLHCCRCSCCNRICRISRKVSIEVVDLLLVVTTEESSGGTSPGKRMEKSILPVPAATDDVGRLSRLALSLS